MKKWKYFATIILALLALCLTGENCFASYDTEHVDVIDTENPQLLIRAIHPGYTVDEVSNVGEFIELMNTSENSLSLTGLTIRYTNSSGNSSSVYDFPDGTVLTGESLLMRFNKSDDVVGADMNYYFNGANGLSATAGKIELVINDEVAKTETVIDTVCWGSMEGCENKKFNNSVLVRNSDTLVFEHIKTTEYTPNFDETKESRIVFPKKQEEEKPEPKCKGLIFSEIFTYYESSNTEQFIEFYNSSADQINLEGCVVRYKNKNYELSGIVKAEEYLVYYPAGIFTLTKNPTSSNTIEIIDVDDSVVDTLVYYNGQKKGVSLAMFGYNADGTELWLQTYAATAGAENNYQKYKSCEDGKVLNEETGNCVKASNVNTTLAACAEGYYRNPLTNRCKKYETTASAELKACAEGYERNPETNRCRKIVQNDGADYPLETEEYEEKSSFVAVIAIIVVAVLGLGYVGWQYREEIGKIFRR